MAVETGPDGFGHRLRPVDVQDAGRIFELRTDPELGRFLNPTTGGVDDQKHWIEQQRKRANDYYFVVETLAGRWEGVIGLYGIEHPSADFGRWLLRRGSLAAPVAILLIMRFGFDQLGLGQICCRTYADALAVVSFHDSCAYTNRSEYIDADGRPNVEYCLTLDGWPAFHESLAPMADRVARRAARS